MRGTFGDGEPHSVPVPVNIAELLRLGSHGACKTVVSGTEEEGIGTTAATGKRSWASAMGWGGSYHEALCRKVKAGNQ